jgi:predicted ATPase
LKLRNWRNFRQVSIELSERAFFVGPNASGKSNLLDSIRFLAEIAHPGSGGLQAAIASRGGLALLRCLHARAPSDVEITVNVGSDEQLEMWRYSLKFNNKKKRLPIILSETVESGGHIIAQQGQSADSTNDEILLSQTLLEQVSQNQGFRELSDFLASCRYLHVVPQIVRDRARAKLDGDDPYGGDLLRRMKSMTKKMRTPRLRRISEALKIAVPQFDNIILEDDADGVPHLQASFSHWRANSSKQSEVSFSDGTLRLIGLLWSIAEAGGPLLLEEPELSLNDAVISELPKMFVRMQRLSGRQVITTTHSSVLLDDTGVGLSEIHRIFVDKNGSAVQTASDNESIMAQVSGGMTPSQAIFPLLRPSDIEKLGNLEIAS